MCKTGKTLHERYVRALERYGADDPRTHEALIDWQLHQRGTAEKPGCPRCSGLKIKREVQDENREIQII